MRINAKKYELLKILRARYATEKLGIERRTLSRIAKKNDEIETAALAGGTVILLISDFTIWLRQATGTKVPQFHTQETKIIDTEDYEVPGKVLEMTGCNRAAFYKAIEKGILPVVTLGLNVEGQVGSGGSQIVHVEATREWHRALFVKQYKHNGESLSLNLWARKSEIPAAVLLERIKKGWTLEKAITTPVKPPFYPTKK